MAAVLWWRSKSKLTIGIVLLMAPALIMFMPAEWTERMGTIKTYDADASAMGRINAWTMAINIANSRILGAGFATDSGSSIACMRLTRTRCWWRTAFTSRCWASMATSAWPCS
jgi:hypothetical protein